jgi:transcription initiation factor TFIID subunit 2
MDLDTLSKRLESGRYPTYGSLFGDFDLIISNCERFNTPNTEPIWHAHILQRAWRTEWEKASKLSYNTKRSLGAFLKKLSEEGWYVFISSSSAFSLADFPRPYNSAAPFNVPIADLVQQVPNYHTFIPVEDARDMLMLRRGVEKDKYLTIEALEADFNLLVQNCYKFNGTESQISYSARELSDKFNKGILKIKTGASAAFCSFSLSY